MVVTVYVDDILLSGPTEEIVNDGLSAIREAAKTSNYAINQQKSTIAKQTISASNINISRQHMVVNSDRFLEFSNAFVVAGSGPRADGIFNYVKSVNPKQASKL